jgi:hypothetical protein
MKVTTIEDAKVLIPNKEHKNFTTNNEIIKKGTELEGKSKKIFGLRRGKPFSYRIFQTNENKIIYLNKIKPMATEVTLGADSSQTATRINLLPQEKSSRNAFIYTIGGGVAGFLWSKYKKHDTKKSALFIGIGAVLGYGLSMVMDSGKNNIFVKPSK